MSKKAEPDFRELLMGSVDALFEERKTVKRPHRDIRTRVPVHIAPLIFKAAALRGLSAAAYLRRAVVAFAAYDLGLDAAQLLEEEPAMRLKGEGPKTNRLEAGRGHGSWGIRGLE